MSTSKPLHRFFIVLGIALIAGAYSLPSHLWANTWVGEKLGLDTMHLTLGLDLAGGTELDYRIDMSETDALIAEGSPISKDVVAENVRDALEKRVNPAGVGEVIVKRSQVEGEEHVLIQLPPSSNVDKAKSDAEQDNRLQFFEEDPAKDIETRNMILAKLKETNAGNWESQAAILTQDENVTLETTTDLNINDIVDENLRRLLENTRRGSVVGEVIETQTIADYKLKEDGTLEILSFPKEVIGIVRLLDKQTTQEQEDGEMSASAQHILIAYDGSENAVDGTTETKAEARAIAEDLLAQVIADPSIFGDLAAQYSDGPSSTNGGDLGTFGPGAMVGPFNDAIFGEDGMTAPGIVPEVIETQFGFHVIQVSELDKNPNSVTVDKTIVSYQMIAWNKDNLRWVETSLGGAQLDIATVGYDEVQQPNVSLLFNSEGADLFADITGRVANRNCGSRHCMIGIKVGETWASQATVRQKILGGSAQISGNYTFERAREEADRLNLGAIAAPVRLSGQMTIEPELGAEQLQRSLQAAIWGLIATIIFMIFMYRAGGFIAGIALIMYSALFIMLLKIWPNSFGGPIVLTLAGVAGMALSIGLAVDGNILIFERMKEELHNGRSLRQSIDIGFERAWAAIRDSNTTTLITCFILFSIGNSVVKGFAITLIVGTLLSMFTAVWVSYGLLKASLLIPFLNNSTLFGVSQKSNK